MIQKMWRLSSANVVGVELVLRLITAVIHEGKSETMKNGPAGDFRIPETRFATATESGMSADVETLPRALE